MANPVKYKIQKIKQVRVKPDGVYAKLKLSFDGRILHCPIEFFFSFEEWDHISKSLFFYAEDVYIKEICDFTEMLQLQQNYDKKLFERYNIDSYCAIQIDDALIEQFGIINNEYKSKWCWWQTDCPPANREIVVRAATKIISLALMKVLRSVEDPDLEYTIDLCGELLARGLKSSLEDSEYTDKKFEPEGYVYTRFSFHETVSNFIGWSVFERTGYYIGDFIKKLNIGYDELIHNHKNFLKEKVHED